ncbi:DUF2071 domain-containing protein [Nonomuraea sp. B19D2]|uniref:DUF2071 domain-containing protein n=1 Tax=Nonomuraea sp. B19D2 TaxID=3159561 RepID=UPI0032DBAECA
MRQPRLSSVVERRLLVNYRLAPEVAARLLPDGLRPQLVRGYAVAGICLLRLGDVRPSWAPKAVGLRSENAAHRIAVEWDGPDGVETGVYIPRRDTASLLNTWAGGRLFPGEHGRAHFEVRETPGELHVAYAARGMTCPPWSVRGWTRGPSLSGRSDLGARHGFIVARWLRRREGPGQRVDISRADLSPSQT